MRRFLILMSILFIMASFSVQCKAENGNGGSTDEEAAFPQSPTAETPAAVKPAEVSREETACDLIEKIFRDCAEAFTKLQKGKELFSPDNDLPFFFIGQSSLLEKFEQLRVTRLQKLQESTELQEPQKLLDLQKLPNHQESFDLEMLSDPQNILNFQNLRSQIPESERIFLEPMITHRTSDDYYLLNFLIEDDYHPAATIACQRDACEDLYQKLMRQDSGLTCMENKYFFYNDLSKRVIGFGTVEQNPRVWPVSPYKETLKFLIQARTTKHKDWFAENVVYDGKTTITLHQLKPKQVLKWKVKKQPIHLKLYCKSRWYKIRQCVLPEPQKMFYEYTVQMVQADFLPLKFKEKPISKIAKMFRKRGKRLPEGSALT